MLLWLSLFADAAAWLPRPFSLFYYAHAMPLLMPDAAADATFSLRKSAY